MRPTTGKQMMPMHHSTTSMAFLPLRQILLTIGGSTRTCRHGGQTGSAFLKVTAYD